MILETKTLKPWLNKKSRKRRTQQRTRKNLSASTYVSGRNDHFPDIPCLWKNVDEVTVPEAHPRILNPDHVEAVTRSINHHGYIDPILVRGGELLDGAVRLEAVKQLGLPQIRCLVLDNLTELEARTYALASNRLSEKGQWDLESLKLEFSEIISLDGDISVTGFSTEEVDIILLDDEESADIAEDIPEPQDALTSQPGDTFTLGDHLILCGDALKNECYKKLLDGANVDLVATDVPYNVPIANNVSGLGKVKHREFAQASGEMSDKEYAAFLLAAFTIWTSLVPKGGVVFSFIDWRGVEHLIHAGKKAGLKLINLAVWNKGSGAMGGFLRSAHELVPIFCNGAHPKTNNVELGKHGRDRTNVWDYPGANRRGSSAAEMLEHHPTPKNLAMIEDAILDVTKRGDIVLDPFLGCGTTLMACETQGRRCRAMELEPRFVDVSIRRWQAHSGQDAIHLASGHTFNALTDLRAKGEDVPSLSSFGCFEPF